MPRIGATGHRKLADAAAVEAGIDAAGEALRRYYPIADTAGVRVSFNFNEVEVIPQAVNMTYAGLWQVNVQVPEVPAGDVRVSVRAGGETSPPILLRAAEFQRARSSSGRTPSSAPQW